MVAPSFHVCAGDGVDMQMRVVAATATRLLQWAWFEDSDDDLGDDDEAHQAVRGPAQQTCMTRVVPRTPVVDVQTRVRYTPADADGNAEIAAVRVLLLSATLNHLIAERRAVGPGSGQPSSVRPSRPCRLQGRSVFKTRIESSFWPGVGVR